MNLSKNVALSLFTALSLAMTGCGSDSSSSDTTDDTTVQTRNVTIDFAAYMGDESIRCSENNVTKIYSDIGTDDDNVSFTDFRFFVSEMALVKADGTAVAVTMENNDFQYQGENGEQVALLDFEDNTGDCHDRGNTPSTNTRIVGSIAEGNYTGIAFTLGVPFDINHDKEDYVDVAVLNQPKMEWNWQAGRKFTKIEVKSESNASLIWNFHLGSTGCIASEDNATVVTASCAQPNRVAVTLDGFDETTDVIALDYKQLLSHNNVGADLGGAKGCMSALTDPECEMMLGGIALDVANQTGECINGGDCSSQQLFSVRSK